MRTAVSASQRSDFAREFRQGRQPMLWAHRQHPRLGARRLEVGSRCGWRLLPSCPRTGTCTVNIFAGWKLELFWENLWVNEERCSGLERLWADFSTSFHSMSVSCASDSERHPGPDDVNESSECFNWQMEGATWTRPAASTVPPIPLSTLQTALVHLMETSSCLLILRRRKNFEWLWCQGRWVFGRTTRLR